VQHGVANKQIKRTRIGPAALTAPYARTVPHRVHSLHFCRYHTAHILQFNAIVGHVAISNSVMNNVADFGFAGESSPAPSGNEFGNEKIRETRSKDFAYDL
jgi:hypothetical protein